MDPFRFSRREATTIDRPVAGNGLSVRADHAFTMMERDRPLKFISGPKGRAVRLGAVGTVSRP
jgi:hypothetical protein